jgi:valyl-tRNA synthetase
MSSTQDVRFNEDKIAQGSQLANKLWNASRLVLMRVGDDAVVPLSRPEPRTLEDRWILSRLAKAKDATARAIEGYEFHRAALGIYDFVYGDLCDWYLELVKPRLYQSDPAHPGEPVGDVALHVLSETLAMAHPVIPFVTEEIWSYLPGVESLLAAGRWPDRDLAPVDEEAEADVGAAIEAIKEIRGWRDALGVRPGATVPARLSGYGAMQDHIARLARLEWTPEGEAAASYAYPRGTFEVLPSDDVDLEAASRRAAERRKVVEAEIRRAEGKLGNERFVERAPEAVVQAERDKLEALRTELAELEAA